MQFQPYNQKDFLAPDSILSMASYHAKIYEDGNYRFRIHDCITSIRLIGKLETEKDFDEAMLKTLNLADALDDFAVHVYNLKQEFFPNQLSPEELEEMKPTIKDGDIMYFTPEKQFSEIVQWQKETFPGATTMSKIEHLKEEIEELSISIAIDAVDKRLEYADCFMLLFGAAAADGMSYNDICAAIDEKMQINRSREWGLPDEKGVVHHIK